MITVLLLAAALSPPAQTPVEVESAFAADALSLGQWTAFREYAEPGAVMFVPGAVGAVRAEDWLRDRKDPPRSVRRQLAQSYQACDGRTAINVGPWQRPDGSLGYFTTVWLYEDQPFDAPRWLWVYDAGDTLRKRMKAEAHPKIRRASCANIPPDDPLRYTLPSFSFPPVDPPDLPEAKLESDDRSLRYDYAVDGLGNRQFKAWLWNGRKFELVLDQAVPARAE